MKLTTRCISCEKDILVKSNAPTRGELQMQMGDEIDLRCPHCGTLQKVHINKVRAEPNNKLIYISIAISILVTIILWFFFGAIGTISMTIPLLFWYQQMNSTKAFNQYMIRRK